jgi:hypothetical protein
MEPTLIKKWDQSKQTVQQMWFAGAHSDVGGGYSDFGLANDALSWMRSEAKKQGLRISSSAELPAPLILHQQRTKDTIIGTGLAKLKGEDIRKDLSPTEQTVIASMSFSKIARRHLLIAPIPENDIRFNNYRKKDRKAAIGHLKIADDRARTLLNKIKGTTGAMPKA